MSTFPDGVLDLPLEVNLALLARVLHREGYDDHVTGHISIRVADGFLFTPRLFSWDEITAADVVRVDASGAHRDGRWSATVAAAMHLAVYDGRPDVSVVVHGHPRYGSLWSSVGSIPPAYDQSSSLGLADSDITLLETYEHVEAPERARLAADALGSSNVMLLANHGVVITGASVPAAHHRAVVFEHRCRTAWQHRLAGPARELTRQERDALGAANPYSDGSLFAAMARREIRSDPDVAKGVA